MSDTLSDAFIAIARFLREAGWHCIEEITNDMGQWIDPITLRSHDIDYAFTVELCRRKPTGSLIG